jgi:hypothetical protein
MRGVIDLNMFMIIWISLGLFVSILGVLLGVIR